MYASGMSVSQIFSLTGLSEDEVGDDLNKKNQPLKAGFSV